LLTIRAEQMQAFEVSLRENYEQRLAKYLAGKYDMKLDASLLGLVHRGVNKAEQYGFSSQQGIATFLEWMIEEGEDFDDDPQRPEARQILNDSDLPEPFKMDMLMRARPWTATPEGMVEDQDS
jgi:hypothetical protein